MRGARVSALTGSVLVLYDPARIELRDVLEEILRAWRTPSTNGGSPNGLPVSPEGSEDGDAWHTLPIEVVAARLATKPDHGLSTDDAEHRLANVGPNALATPRPRSALSIVMDHLGSLPSVLLIGAAALSVVTGAALEAAVIVAVVAANTVIGYVTESRIERLLTSLQGTGASQVLVRRDGRDLLLSAAVLVPGDVLVLRAGHPIGADARLVLAEGLAVDEASLTGESLPAGKKATVLPEGDLPLSDRANMVFSGTAVVEGTGLAVVTATGERTELGRMRRLLADAVTPSSPLERQLEKTGRDLVMLCLALSGATLLLGVVRGVPVLEMVRTALSLAVAAVPEGLPAVATTTLALGMQRMMRRGMLVRRLTAVENLGAVTVICADKTGTLTENRMTVDGWHVAGRAYRGAETIPAASTPALRLALSVAVLCNEAELVSGSSDVLGSSTEGALLTAARMAGLDYRAERARFPLLFVQPRANGDNWMATVHAERGGRLIAVKGAPEQVLTLADRYISATGEERRLTPAARHRIIRSNVRMAARGLRVLGLAFKHGDTDGAGSYTGLVWVGLVGLADPVRPGVADALAVCRRAGIRTLIITGDQAHTAAAIARERALTPDGRTARVLDATRLAELDEFALREAVRDVDVFARVSPADKFHIVRALQASGEIVAMTGDGINDAAALRAADIGIAMGARGTDVARDVADVVLIDDDFGAIVAAIAQGRGIHGNVTKALRFLLATNLNELLVTAGAMAVGVARPMSALQFLWINLLSDVAPALALAVEPPEADVMSRPPRDPAEPILSRAVLADIAREGGVLAAAALGARALVATRTAGTAATTTAAFSTLTIAQLLHALAYRTRGTDRTLLTVVGSSIAVQGMAILFPPLRRTLGLVPLGIVDWGLVAGAAALPSLLSGRAAAPPVASRTHTLLDGGDLHGHAEPNRQSHREAPTTRE